MGVIVDTSAIIELERNRQSWKPLLSRLGSEAAFLPSIVWAELMAGVHLADTVERALKRRAKLERLRQRLSILSFTLEIAELWAALFAELHKEGTPIPSNDLCVISTAVFHGHRILVSSSDELHFKRVDKAEVVTL